MAAELTLTVPKADLFEVVCDLTPTRIELSKRPRRVLHLGRPRRFELVPNRGLRVRGDARVAWEALGLALPVTLRAWQILLVPSVVVQSGAHVLAFDPVLEDLDFKRVPGFFDERLVEAVNDGLASQRRKLAWNFSKTLSFRLPLPARVSPGGTFELVPSSGDVEVTADAIRLSVAFEAKVTLNGPRPAVDEPQASPLSRPALAPT